MNAQHTPMRFDGKTYVPERDEERLTTQSLKVWDLMKDGQWRTLAEISAAVGAPEASISARLRDFRKDRFGSHTIERHFVRRGLYQYRLVPNLEPTPKEAEHDLH